MSYDDISAALDALSKAGDSLASIWAKHFGQPPCMSTLTGDIANVRNVLASVLAHGGPYSLASDVVTGLQRWYILRTSWGTPTMVGVYYDNQKTAQAECDRLNKLTQ